MSALDGRLIAISVSDAPDRERLGFPQREIDRAVLSICTALVRAGAQIAYGGNLDPDGYTFKIFRHLAGAYAGARDTPFHHFIPGPVARVTRYEDLYAILTEGRGVVWTEIARGDAIVTARPGGGGIRLGEDVVKDDAQLAAWFAAVPDPPPAQAYSATRRAVTSRADARVIAGGKMGILAYPADAYAGAMPGIVEEAILTLEGGKPLVVLGSFGGAARDIAIALGLIDPTGRVPRTEQHASYAPSIERVAALSTRIPNDLRSVLRAIADDDRAEQAAYQVAAVIQQWIAKKGLAA
jgi:hypothetical protein